MKLFFLIQAPHDPAAGSDEEENETVEDCQFALVDGREKLRTQLKFLMKLKISHRHHAAGQKSGKGVKNKGVKSH